jgi:hypothetical protein
LGAYRFLESTYPSQKKNRLITARWLSSWIRTSTSIDYRASMWTRRSSKSRTSPYTSTTLWASTSLDSGGSPNSRTTHDYRASMWAHRSPKSPWCWSQVTGQSCERVLACGSHEAFELLEKV